MRNLLWLLFAATLPLSCNNSRTAQVDNDYYESRREHRVSDGPEEYMEREREFGDRGYDDTEDAMEDRELD